MHQEKYDRGAESLINFMKGELEHGKETPEQFATRALDEAAEKLDDGLHSSTEASALIASLNLVLEKTHDPIKKAAAQQYISDLNRRYPGIRD